MRSSRASLLSSASLAIGAALRVALAVVNREANDDHIEVVLALLAGGRQPNISTCNECFQPKLFHLACAWIARALDLSTRDQIAVSAQLLNVAFGTGVLLIGWWLVTRLSADPWVRFLAVSWLALNPGLMGIDVQATNDSLLILVGAVLLASLYRWIAIGSRTATSLLAVVLAAGLAPHVKGNGIVLTMATLLCVGTVVWVRSMSWRPIRSLAVMLAIVSLVWVTARINRSYRDNYKATGAWLATNMAPSPPPLLFRQTLAERPGVTSIVSAFFTFRFIDLVETPYNMEGVAPHALHRTSLWSQLYARTYVLHFDQWPPSWKDRSDAVLWLGRSLLVLGLFPTWLMIAGATDVIRRSGRPDPASVIFLLFAAAMLSFSVAYCVRYRDVSVMKAIFVFPALLAFLYFYVEGVSRRLVRRPLRTFILSAHVAMLVLWVAEALILVSRLAAQAGAGGFRA